MKFSLLFRKVRHVINGALSARFAAQRFAAESREPEHFDFPEYAASVTKFVESLRVGETLAFKYSPSSSAPTLYGSVYACLTFSLLGKLESIREDERRSWVSYFDSFQNPQDGLFYDPAVDSALFRSADWWGARHLALHIVAAYAALGARPAHPFHFLRPYSDPDRIRAWLDAFDWNASFSHAEDIDNKIMNVGCLLQYQRDEWGDESAGRAVLFLQEYLAEKVRSQTGMWGLFDPDNRNERSRMVQFAYHIFPLFFYDALPILHAETIVREVLDTQNRCGGFGVKINSSACEDIDSIDLLIRFARSAPALRAETEAALRKAFRWVLANQLEDGGFVFRLNEPFVYGHPETSSRRNEGALFPTWFRTLSLAYLSRFFDAPSGFHLVRAPGY